MTGFKPLIHFKGINFLNNLLCFIISFQGKTNYQLTSFRIIVEINFPFSS
jgi:hypothetical protein